ncbi:MAG: hypothetical protein GY884_11295 [Proteobacteria bacterium]|nr:hypothetical protein [Pseudomonadota bacterium]
MPRFASLLLALGALSLTAGCSKDLDDDGTEDMADCGPDDPNINPDAEEICDGADNNCDSEIDESTAVDALERFPDTDADGLGDMDGGVWTCDELSGHIEDGTDCDDTEATVNPDAAEICDSLDNDCDGSTDHEWNVPADFGTIQAALDDMADGEGACIDAGTYTETLSWPNLDITLAGAGSSSTIIDANGSRFLSLESGQEVSILGLGITNSWNDGGVSPT